MPRPPGDESNDERVAGLIRELIVEPDVMKRAALCDTWGGVFLLGQIEAGVDAVQAERTCAALVAGAIVAADALVGLAAARSPSDGVH